MNQTPITFDDLSPEERVVYLKAAQRLLDYSAKASNQSQSST